MKAKYILGAIIIIAAGVLGFNAFQSSITPYVSIDEAVKSGETVQVKGIRGTSGTFDTEANIFKFTLEDEKGKKINVVYDGAKPGNFDQAKEIVCIGEYKNGVFHAKNILVKCPSKYQAMEAKA